MPRGKWCLCPNTQTQLWTSRQSWHERVPASGNRVHFQWRCGKCQTKRSTYVDSLWRKTFLMSGGAPSCELGCVGGPVHFGRECGRTIGQFDVALKAFSGEREPTIRVSLAHGADFVKVISAHRTHIVFLELPITELRPLRSASVSFSIGVCIFPTCLPGSTIAATYRTKAFIDGVVVEPGKLPYTFKIKTTKARVLSYAKFCGMPLGSFMGISAPTCKNIWASSCALQRYAHIFYGHTSKRTKAKFNEDICRSYQPQLNVGRELAPLPQPVCWKESGSNYVCAYCKKEYSSRAKFIAGCAPELME